MTRESSGNVYDKNLESQHGPWGEKQSHHGPYGGKDNIQLSASLPNAKPVKPVEKPERKS